MLVYLCYRIYSTIFQGIILLIFSSTWVSKKAVFRFCYLKECRIFFRLRYLKFFQFFIRTVWLYSLVFLETPFLFGGKVLEPSGQYLWWAELYSIAFTHIKITRILYIIIPLAISDFNLSNKILRQQDLLMCVQGLSVIVQINILQCKAWI